MPLYDYDCAECGRRVEVIHGVHSPGPTHCPNCGGGPLRKAITAPAVHFKGSGWAKKERHAAVASATSRTGDAATAGDGDTKTTDGDNKTSPAKDGPTKDGPASPAEGAPGKPGDGGRRDERSAASKPAGAGTATKTD
jgi:putative FmdB family regulatory protein